VLLSRDRNYCVAQTGSREVGRQNQLSWTYFGLDRSADLCTDSKSSSGGVPFSNLARKCLKSVDEAFL